MSGKTAVTPNPRIWIECDDLVGHFDGWATPTGICRVQLEVIPRLLELAQERIVLCRLGRNASQLRAMTPAELFRLTDTNRLLSLKKVPWIFAATRALRFARRRTGWVVWRQLASFGLVGREEKPSPGDWLLAMGGTWSNPGFAAAAQELKVRHGMRIALLVHDILPVSHPGLVARGQVARFTRWIDDMSGLIDQYFTPSRHVADVLSAHLATVGRGAVPVCPLPFGSGFSPATDDDTHGAAPVAEPFVLYVSTIEVRKNHLFLARVWKKLVERHGAASVPALVLVGRHGWESGPFWRYMAETDYLGGKIKILSNLSDAELDRAYQSCLFTVFPSLCEGWGLPVSESLAHGKLCVASSATSIPEAGLGGADYFVPTDKEEAVAALSRALFSPGYRQAREAWIKTNIPPRDWDGAARTVLDTLQNDRNREERAGIDADC